MRRTLLSCEGITVGSLMIPRFQLNVGDFVCLHLPDPASGTAENAVVRALMGKSRIPGLAVFGRIELPPVPLGRGGLLGLLPQPKATAWLQRAAGIAADEAMATVTRLGIRPEWRIDRFSGTQQVLLGLEACWGQGPDAIVFHTTALDHLGRNAVFAAVSSHLDNTAAIHLSYAYETQGRRERLCPAGALCIPARNLADPTLSLQPDQQLSS